MHSGQVAADREHIENGPTFGGDEDRRATRDRRECAHVTAWLLDEVDVERSHRLQPP